MEIPAHVSIRKGGGKQKTAGTGNDQHRCNRRPEPGWIIDSPVDGGTGGNAKKRVSEIPAPGMDKGMLLVFIDLENIIIPQLCDIALRHRCYHLHEDAAILAR